MSKEITIKLDPVVQADLYGEMLELTAMNYHSPLTYFLFRLLERLGVNASHYHFDANPEYMETFHAASVPG